VRSFSRWMTRLTARSAIRSSGRAALPLALLLFGALGPLGSGGRAADVPTAQECLACHADRDLKRGTPGPGRGESVFVDSGALKASPHGRLDCVACHRAATAPHDERLPPVRCAECHGKARTALSEGIHGSPKAQARAPAPTCAACHGTHAVRPAASLGIEACAICHRQEVRVYRESIHGRSRQRGNSEAATCSSCHGQTHALLAKSDSRAPTYHLNLPRTCGQCHADPELVKRYKIPVGNVYQLYMDSIHGRALTRSGLLVAANCSDCHGTHDIRRRTDPAARVYRANVPNTCGQCHAGVMVQYEQGIHGVEVKGGNPLAPVCTDCHTAHQIRRVEAEAWKLEIVRECGTCHAESLRTYRDTFHGQVTALGFTRTARCSDCHGAHDILPAGDPRSRVSPANRVATCRTCHPAANVNFVKYDPHADPDNRARNPLLYYAARFMTWLLVGVFAFFGLHTSLWGARALVARRRGAAPPSTPEESASGEEGDRG